MTDADNGETTVEVIEHRAQPPPNAVLTVLPPGRAVKRPLFSLPHRPQTYVSDVRRASRQREHAVPPDGAPEAWAGAAWA